MARDVCTFQSVPYFILLVFAFVLFYTDKLDYDTYPVSSQFIRDSNLKFPRPIRHKTPVTQYSNSWYEKAYENFFSKKEYNDCPSCSYESKTEKTANSSPKDLILVYSLGGVKNLILFMRTLRHVKCKATVVLFIDTDGYKTITPETKEVLKRCGMNIIDIGVYHLDSIIYRWSFGFFAMFDFLKKHEKYINRVLICDLFDIVFQGDPFEAGKYNNIIRFVSEAQKFSNTIDNREWIRYYLGSFPEQWNNSQVTNSGQVCGSVREIIKFLDEYLSLFDPNDISTINTTDQAYFNLLIKQNKLKEARIPHVVETKDMYSRLVVTQPLNDDERRMGTIRRYASNRIAPIVHMYYADYSLSFNLLDVCPRLTKKWTNYSRLFPDEDIDRYYEKNPVS